MTETTSIKSKEFYGASLEFFQAAYEPVFDKVKNAEHWKLPINAIIPNHPTLKKLVQDAIVYYVAGEVEFHPIPDTTDFVRVTSPGYYGNGA